ncbi:MAG TPA: hypothetical protein IAA30_02420 [Candidatus Treponema faecavium]|nr:hypothetical protein [Candidatus Treponema faecavium]
MSDSELSPEIAALLAAAEETVPDTDFEEPPVASFDADGVYVPAEDSSAGRETRASDVDLSRKSFEPIKEFFSAQPQTVFDDPTYYKTALSGENASAQRLHTLLSKYLKATDPADRTVFRQQLTSAYWEFLRGLAPKMGSSSIALCKRMLMRFAVVLPSLFTAEQRQTFSSVFVENRTGEPVYYLDEWFREIAQGRLTISMTDEGRPARKNAGSASEEAAHIQQLLSKNSGKLQNVENLITGKENQRSMLEAELRSRVDQLCEHTPFSGAPHHSNTYTDSQKRMITEINDRLRMLLKTDRELGNLFRELTEAKETENALLRRMSDTSAAAEVSSADIMTEFDTVRQMAKMTVGRKGNHFPIFTREYYHCMPRTTGFRENVVDILAWIESIDPNAFCRVHKNVSNRIVPYVLLLPTYGDMGMCWEPFDRYNRITSRGRIAVPMYPKDLRIAVLTAVADLRWQVAKEKASYYWMEEGLTGQYYQWLLSEKLKGDIKDYFIADYVLWMTKESAGVQRLPKEVRGIFWRFMPFAQNIKDMLKTRSVVYQELYQRDINRSMSDGY